MTSQQGFTLVELLVAIALLAVVGAVAGRALYSTVEAERQTLETETRQQELVRAINIVETDLMSMVPRTARASDDGIPAAAFVKPSDVEIVFTRGGLTPLASRTGNSRVGYYLADRGLYRRSRNMIDVFEQEQGTGQLLLSGVESLEFIAYSQGQETQELWPPSSFQSSPGGGADPVLRDLPAAVALRLELDDLGIVEYVFPVAP